MNGYHDVIIDGVHECVPNPPEHTPEYLIGLKYGGMDGQVGIYDLAEACGKYRGTAFDHCSFGYRTAYVTNCLNSKFGCGDGPTTLPETTSHASNFTATTTTSSSNFTIPASGGKGTYLSLYFSHVRPQVYIDASHDLSEDNVRVLIVNVSN